MAGGPTRSDTYSVNVQIANPKSGVMENYGVWDKMSGGDMDSSEQKFYPGGMQSPISLGGRPTVPNLVVQRLYRLGRDHDVIQKMFDCVGRSRCTVSKQPLDINGNVYGRPIVFNGTLKRVKPPDVDSETNTAGLLEIEVTIDGFPTS